MKTATNTDNNGSSEHTATNATDTPADINPGDIPDALYDYTPEQLSKEITAAGDFLWQASASGDVERVAAWQSVIHRLCTLRVIIQERNKKREQAKTT